MMCSFRVRLPPGNMSQIIPDHLGLYLPCLADLDLELWESIFFSFFHPIYWSSIFALLFLSPSY